MVDEIRGMLHRVEETREMAVMGEFASSISHEIRNPLTSIKLNLQSLDQEAEQEGISRDSARSLRICLREVARLDGAVHRILDMARTHPPTRVASSLHEILHGSVDLLRSQLDAQGVEVSLRLEAPRDTVLADPEDLKSVFVNLLVNAGEAMPDGGTVRLTTENPSEEEGRATIRIFANDDGPGVPDAVRERIFRPFVSTKEDGTGFGLAIARVMVQEHEGRIELAAGDGFGGEAGHGGEGGATFVVELPLHDPSSAEEGDHSPGEGATEEGATEEGASP
jgi:signal transduction histidine kinase